MSVDKTRGGDGIPFSSKGTDKTGSDAARKLDAALAGPGSSTSAGSPEGANAWRAYLEKSGIVSGSSGNDAAERLDTSSADDVDVSVAYDKSNDQRYFVLFSPVRK